MRLEVPDYDEEKRVAVSVKSAMQSLGKNIRYILIFFVTFLLISVAASFAYFYVTRQHTGSATALVMFGFPEAEEGLDPRGLPLDANAMRSPFVIGQALDALELRQRGISAEDIRSNLSLNAVVPHDTLDRVLLIRESALRDPARLMELEEVFYHPTQFLLQLNRAGNLASLSGQEMDKLLNEIVRQYATYFVQTFNELYFLDVVVGHFDPAEYEYFEIVQILRGTISNMLSYTNSMKNTAPDFRSPTTMMTFRDIWANLELVRTVDIHRVSALIHANNMSRNRSRSAIILEYNISRMEAEMAVARADAESALFLIDLYERETWSLPHMEDYYVYSRATEMYDGLFKNARDNSEKANQLEVDINNYRESLLALSGAISPSDPHDVRFVEDAIPQLFASLRDWETTVNQTVEDFLTLELYRDAVRLVSPSGFVSSMAAYRQMMIWIVLAGSIAGLFIGALVALYKGKAF